MNICTLPSLLLEPSNFDQTGKPREISQAISYFKMAALSVSQLSMSWLALLSYLDKSLSGLKNGLALLGKRSNTDFIIIIGKNSCLEAELVLIIKLLASSVVLVGLSPIRNLD